jgi:hypothetical protein
MTETILDDQLDKPSIQGEGEHYLLSFFGRQSGYYLEMYHAFHQGNKFTFNIGACVFGVFWLLYRKLFRESLFATLILIGIGFFLAFAYELLGIDEARQTVIEWIVNFATWISFGFVGNYLYLKHADKNVQKILASWQDEETKLKLLRRKGGVSALPFILALVLILLYLFLAGGGSI